MSVCQVLVWTVGNVCDSCLFKSRGMLRKRSLSAGFRFFGCRPVQCEGLRQLCFKAGWWEKLFRFHFSFHFSFLFVRWSGASTGTDAGRPGENQTKVAIPRRFRRCEGLRGEVPKLGDRSISLRRFFFAVSLRHRHHVDPVEIRLVEIKFDEQSQGHMDDLDVEM